MSTVQDLQTDLQAVEDGVKALAVLITDLRNAGPGPVSQAQLDALDVEAKAIVDAINVASQTTVPPVANVPGLSVNSKNQLVNSAGQRVDRNGNRI